MVITNDRIKQAEATGQYQFPFTEGFCKKAITDDDVSFQDFIDFDENWLAQIYLGQRYRYTFSEMEGIWGMILVQRTKLKAILMVVDGKCIGINQALRKLNAF